MSGYFSLSVFFLLIVVIFSLVLALYIIYWKPIIAGPSCQINQDCQINQYCYRGICTEILCNDNSDCDDTSQCINSYCQPYRCIYSNDCPNNMACNSDGICVNIGTSCGNNIDCSGLSCVNNICVQCTSNSNCVTGQACFDNICRYPYSNEVAPNTVTIMSLAQNNGNIIAPPGYSCNKIGCTNNGNTISCTGGNFPNLCPSSCPYCIDSICRCTIGQDLEQCRSNADCLSGLCSNNICIPIGQECATNAGGDILPCPVNFPYCVYGKCSDVSLNAICGATGMPEDLCYSPQSLGKAGVTGITPDGMGFFCVNGRCSNTPGELNQLCTINSCTTFDNNILTCTEVHTPDITLMRCLL